VVPQAAIATAAYRGSVATEEMEQLRSTARQIIDRDGSVRLLLEYGDIEELALRN